ncbi:MAG TPA: hypothetical protein VI072_14830 [Polyangiaceae bacterium]
MLEHHCRRARRALLLPPLTAVFLAALLVTPSARATLSRAVSLDELSRASTTAAIVLPLQQRSEWQAKRIVTFTRVRVERVVAGQSVTSEIEIRTFGGVVGNIGQTVSGEADLVVGQRSLMFLRELGAGSALVTARAQGVFRIEVGSAARVLASQRLGELVPSAQMKARRIVPAAVSLHGSSLALAVSRIQLAWSRREAR